MTVYQQTTTEGLQVGLKPTEANGWNVTVGTGTTVQDGIKMTASVTPLRRATASVRELMKLQATLAATGVYNIIAPIEQVRLRTALQHAMLAILSERLAVTGNASVALAMKLIDRMKVTTGVQLQASLGVMLAETFGLSTYAVHGLAAFLREGIAMGDQSSWLYTSLARIVEGIALNETWGRSMTALVIEREDIVLDDSFALQMLFNVLLQEGLWVGHELVTPTGGLTTWATNARSGAISEYQNWPFNSYARFGDGYLAAAIDGLYALDGDRDQTTPIIAKIGKELVEMTGSHLTGLGPCYVAMRSRDGRPIDVFLKVTGDHQETLYRFQASRLRTARVDLGKGWRTRYMSWELVTVGDDFDLTGLEFLPIQFTRRTQG